LDVFGARGRDVLGLIVFADDFGGDGKNGVVLDHGEFVHVELRATGVELGGLLGDLSGHTDVKSSGEADELSQLFGDADGCQEEFSRLNSEQ